MEIKFDVIFSVFYVIEFVSLVLHTFTLPLSRIDI